MLDKAEASRLLRDLKEDRYGMLDRGIEDRADTIERRQRDIVRLLDVLCRGMGVQ
jgi:hypothetical protein